MTQHSGYNFFYLYLSLALSFFPSHLHVACCNTFGLPVYTVSVPIYSLVIVKKRDSYLPCHHDGDGPHKQVDNKPSLTTVRRVVIRLSWRNSKSYMTKILLSCDRIVCCTLISYNKWPKNQRTQRGLAYIPSTAKSISAYIHSQPSTYHSSIQIDFREIYVLQL